MTSNEDQRTWIEKAADEIEGRHAQGAAEIIRKHCPLDAERDKLKSILNGKTYDYCQCGNLDVDELAGILGFTRNRKGDWE